MGDAVESLEELNEPFPSDRFPYIRPFSDHVVLANDSLQRARGRGQGCSRHAIGGAPLNALLQMLKRRLALTRLGSALAFAFAASIPITNYLSLQAAMGPTGFLSLESCDTF